MCTEGYGRREGEYWGVPHGTKSAALLTSIEIIIIWLNDIKTFAQTNYLSLDVHRIVVPTLTT